MAPKPYFNKYNINNKNQNIGEDIMQEENKEKSPFSVVDHIGIIVKDMESTVNFFKSLGMGPFSPASSGGTVDREIPGKSTHDVKYNIQMMKMGTLRVELIEPVSGDTPQKEFLETRGEGVNHISFRVDDMDKETEKLVEKGFNVSMKVKFKPNGGCVYLDSNKTGGVTLELLQPPKRI